MGHLNGADLSLRSEKSLSLKWLAMCWTLSIARFLPSNCLPQISQILGPPLDAGVAGVDGIGVRASASVSSSSLMICNAGFGLSAAAVTSSVSCSAASDSSSESVSTVEVVGGGITGWAMMAPVLMGVVGTDLIPSIEWSL